MKMPSKKKMEASVEAWNKSVAIGDPVTVTLDSGEIKVTKTTSAAEMLSGHTPVVWLDGVRGCYILSRVKSIKTTNASE